MLVLKLVGVVMLMALALGWKRARLPLVLLLLLALLYRMLCSSEAPVEPRDHAPYKPYDTVCPYPDTSCNEPGAVVDGGPSLLLDVASTTPD